MLISTKLPTDIRQILEISINYLSLVEYSSQNLKNKPKMSLIMPEPNIITCVHLLGHFMMLSPSLISFSPD